MFSIVRVTVVETREHCPFYEPGDTFLLQQQCFDPAAGTPQQFCMHSLNDIYETYMRLRRAPVGSKEVVGCCDGEIAVFELERLPDRQGAGWNRPPAGE